MIPVSMDWTRGCLLPWSNFSSSGSMKSHDSCFNRSALTRANRSQYSGCQFRLRSSPGCAKKLEGASFLKERKPGHCLDASSFVLQCTLLSPFLLIRIVPTETQLCRLVHFVKWSALNSLGIKFRLY